MNRKRGAGEGSISKRKNGLWQGAVTIGRNDDGSQKRKYFYGKTRNDVTAKITEAIRELRKDCFINVSESPTLKEWMNTWLWIYKKNSLKQTTAPSQQKWTQKSFKKRNESQYFVNLLKPTAFIPRFA